MSIMLELSDEDAAKRKRLQQLRDGKITEACKMLKELFPEGFALFVNAELGNAKSFDDMSPYAFVPSPTKWFANSVAVSAALAAKLVERTHRWK